MKKIFFVLMAALIGVPTLANNTTDGRELAGRITDAVDGSPVVGATIYFPDLKQGTVTNADGKYLIANLPTVTTTVQVSFVGHQTIVQTIDLATQRTLDFVLTEENAVLDAVVVTGLTGAMSADRTPSPVSVVGQRELQLTPSTNIIDAVAHQPGMAQITTGGGISKPVIRGLGFNRIVVVSGGIRQEGQQWGDEHGIEVDGHDVHSVEILKGPASLMFGSDAIAGVLVLHEQPVMPQGTIKANVSAEYQTNNRLADYTLNFAGNRSGLAWNCRWSQKAAGEYKNSADGRVPGSQFSEQALSAMVGVNRNWGYSHLKMSGYHLKPGLVEGERDDDDNLCQSEAYQQIHHYKIVSDNSLIINGGSLKAIVGYQQNRRQEYEEEDELGLDFRLHTVNYDIHYLSFADSLWRIAAGVSGMWQYSENLGNEYLIPSYKLFDAGLFVSATRTLGAVTVSGGLRADNRHLHSFSLIDDGEERFADFSRNFRALTGSLGAIYNISKQLNVRLNLSRGFRAPNLSELGSNGEHEGTFRYELGNTNLAAEHSSQADLGVAFASEKLSVQLSAFANRIDNYIYLERLQADSNIYQYQSGDAWLTGGEALVDIHIVEQLHFENTFSYVRARQLHQPDESQWLPFTPAPRLTSVLRYDIVRDGRRLNNTFAQFGVEHFWRQDNAHTAYGTETPTPAYTLLNCSIGTDIKLRGCQMTVLLTGSNLTDKAYQSHLSRLKYADGPGICNMGRNFGLKVIWEY